MSTRPAWQMHASAGILIVAIGFLVFGRSLTMAYLADDYDWIVLAATDEPIFETIENIGTGTYFRPLQLLTLRLEQTVASQYQPFLHHLSNLAFHISVGLLVYAIGYNLIRRRLAAVGLALLFLLHPLVVTTVFWISNRADSLVTLFYLLGIWSFLHFIQGARWPAALLSLLSVLGALLSKEMGVSLVVSLAILWVVFRYEMPDRLVADRLRVAALLGLQSFITLTYLLFLWFRSYGDGRADVLAVDWLQIPEVLVAAVMVVVLPNRKELLTSTYELYPWLLPVGLVLLALAAVGAIWWLRRRETAPSVLPFAVAATLVVISLSPLLFSGVNSRRMYLPWAIACVALAVLPVFGSRRLESFLCVLAVLLAIPSLSEGSKWVHNWDLTERYCASFREVMREVPQDTGLLFLTVPGRARDVALYSNDANPALFRCYTGVGGYFPRFFDVSQYRTQEATPGTDSFTLTQKKPGVFYLETTGPGSYFYLWPDPEAGDSYVSENLVISVDAVNDVSQVTAFTVTLPNLAVLTDIRILSFEGLTIQPIPVEASSS